MKPLEMERQRVGDDTPRGLWNTVMTALLGQRRQFLIHRRLQVRMALFNLVTTGVVICLLFLLNVTFLSTSRQATESLVSTIPQLGADLSRMDRIDAVLTVVISILVAGCVFTLGVLRSHRVAGAAFNLHRCLDGVASGRYGTRVRLRRRDDLQELGDAFNRMSDHLTRTTLSEIEVLERTLTAVRSGDLENHRDEIDSGLVELIREKRRRLD